MEKKVNAVIQARMGSTRLPGKVLLDIEGIPILGHIVNRLRKIEKINEIIIATSNCNGDDPIESFCRKREINYVRGSESNVLDRFRMASVKFPADIYIRATGDNPMIDIDLIESMLNYFVENQLNYTCYKNYPIGSGVEIFSKYALDEAVKNADKPFELEHVTPYMYQRMNENKVAYYVSDVDDSKLRMTIDTEQDLEFAKMVFSKLYNDNPYFGIKEVKRLLKTERELSNINSNVHQKKLGE